jgi:hypothetical protein
MILLPKKNKIGGKNLKIQLFTFILEIGKFFI